MAPWVKSLSLMTRVWSLRPRWKERADSTHKHAGIDTYVQTQNVKKNHLKKAIVKAYEYFQQRNDV